MDMAKLESKKRQGCAYVIKPGVVATTQRCLQTHVTMIRERTAKMQMNQGTKARKNVVELRSVECCLKGSESVVVDDDGRRPSYHSSYSFGSSYER
jgi:hypothetical protein